MPETSNFVVLMLGLVLGLRHAADADHIVAVTTFVGKEKQILRACAIGLFWGIGHTLALSAAGLVVIGLRIPISEWLAERLELLVAVMIVLLGARLIAGVHHRWHEHHHDFDWRQGGMKPLLVGLVHGAAGSAALTLLVLSTIPSTIQALIYIIVFGVGSIIGMLVISVALSLPLYWASHRMESAIRPIQLSAGAFSCLFGIYLAIDIIGNLS